MTKKEKKKLQMAIKLLWVDCDLEKAMDILLPLAGLEMPLLKMMLEGGTETIKDVVAKDGNEYDVCN